MIPKLLMDVLQVFAWLAAATGVAVTSFKALAELRGNRLLRAEELRWKRASLAREILDEMMSKETIKNAMLMLDWNGRVFRVTPAQTEAISWGDIRVGLRIPREGDVFSAKEVYVRDAFDDLFDALERIEHYLRTDLILVEDVQFPLEYLVKNLRKHERGEAVIEYVARYEYALVPDFLDRFVAWQSNASENGTI